MSCIFGSTRDAADSQHSQAGIWTATCDSVGPAFADDYASRDVPRGTRLAASILSSRGAGGCDRSPRWLAAFRVAIAQTMDQQYELLTCPGTTTHGLLSAMAAALPIRLQTLAPAETHSNRESLSSTDVGAWDDAVLQLAGLRTAVAGDVGHTLLADQTRRLARALPLADRLLARTAQVIYVLRVRQRGQLARVLDVGYACGLLQNRRVFLAIGHGCVSPSLARRWTEQGAIAWYVLGDGVRVGATSEAEWPTKVSQADVTSRLVPLSSLPMSRYLAHWTRRQHGAWPGQDDASYARDLMAGPATADRSELASLRRILVMQRLIASSRLLRAAVPAVCFTARPLAEFRSARVFRPQHRRWDFEHYGLAIDRDWLIDRGTRAVSYGDDRLWQQLAHTERPFFQAVGDCCVSQGWQSEQEWRHLGDVDLSLLPAERGVVFVPHRAAAMQIAALSPWPITIVPD